MFDVKLSVATPISIESSSAEAVPSNISEVKGILTIRVDTNNNYLPPITKYDAVEYKFNSNGLQLLTFEIDTNAPPVNGKPRFHFAFVRANRGHLHWIQQLHKPTSVSGQFEPHPGHEDDLPETAQAVRLHMNMTGKMSIYFRLFVKDRLTGAYIDCDPQASNDPDLGLITG